MKNTTSLLLTQSVLFLLLMLSFFTFGAGITRAEHTEYLSAHQYMSMHVVQGETQTLAQNNQQVENIQSQQIAGEVLKKENSTLFVQTENGVKQFKIPTDIVIKKNTMDGSFADIRPNDQVNITYTQQGQVLSVDATANEVFDFAKYAIPGGILALITLIVLYSAYKKNNAGHIKTMPQVATQ
jgi:hypothetical protein